MQIRNAIISCIAVTAACAFGSQTFADSRPIQPGVDYVPNTVLVKFRPGTPGRDKAATRSAVGATLDYSYTIVPGLELLVSANQSVPELLQRLDNNPNIEFAEPDYIVTVGATPNDLRLGELWGMHRIDAPTAWDTWTGNAGYTVAVIDTGVDYSHPDLVANMWTNPGEIPGNGYDDDGNGYIDDVYGYDFVSNDADPWDGHGHGTHTAGTVCAKGDNGIGVVGVVWNCRIMALKFLSDQGGGSTANAVKALEYAVDKGVRLSNNSWGGGGYSDSLAQALTAAAQAEHLFVAAAGNSNVDTDSSPHYPSSYGHDNVISVASTQQTNDAKSSFSNYGLNSVDLGAPGSSILSTLPNNRYASWSGTSMATPHVVGALALMASVNPGWTADELKGALLASVEPLPSLDGKTLTGGLLDVAAAIASSPGGGGGGGNTAPTAEFSFVTDGLTVDFTDSSSDPDGTVESWSWDFDDGNSSSARNPSHTFAIAGTYYVALIVTDDDGATDDRVQSVTVSEPVPQPPAAPTNLTAAVDKSGRGKEKTINSVILHWTDNSDDETGFVIEGCEQVTTGKGKNREVTCNFKAVGNVSSNTTSFVVDHLRPENNFRVKAVNDEGSSAWSNEVKI